MANIFSTWLNKNLKNYHNKIALKKFVVNDDTTAKYLHTNNVKVNDRTLYKNSSYPLNIYTPTSKPYGYESSSTATYYPSLSYGSVSFTKKKQFHEWLSYSEFAQDPQIGVIICDIVPIDQEDNTSMTIVFDDSYMGKMEAKISIVASSYSPTGDSSFTIMSGDKKLCDALHLYTYESSEKDEDYDEYYYYEHFVLYLDYVKLYGCTDKNNFITWIDDMSKLVYLSFANIYVEDYDGDGNFWFDTWYKPVSDKPWQIGSSFEISKSIRQTY